MFHTNRSPSSADALSRRSAKARRHSRAARQRGMRPVVEALEDRTLLAPIFTSSFGKKNASLVAVDGWVDGDGNKTDCHINNKDPRPGGPTSQHARVSKGCSLTRTIDTTGLTSVRLSYFWRTDAEAEPNDFLRVEFRVVGDPTFTLLASHPLNTDRKSVV